MCVVSMVMDHAQDRWPQQYPWVQPFTNIPGKYTITSSPSQEEFDRLKREVESLKDLLSRAKEYDKQNNEPDCEIESKVNFVRKVAESVGVSLEDILKKDA